MQKRPLHIFISHSSNDLPFTEKLAKDLRATFGALEFVWYDAFNLSGGESWWPAILAELERSTIFLIVCSPDAMNSAWVNDEITIAWKKRYEDRQFRLIPLLYRSCKLRLDLNTLQCISFLQPTSYQEAFQKLLKTLEGTGISPTSSSSAPSVHLSASFIDTFPSPQATMPVNKKNLSRQSPFYLPLAVPADTSRQSLLSSDQANLADQGQGTLLLNSRLSRRVVIGGMVALIVAGGSMIWLRTQVPQRGTLLYTYKGHSRVVEAVAWSPDSKRIASGSDDHTVQVWNAADGTHPYTYKDHANIVETVAWSPNGKYIASGGDDHTIQIWNAVDGTKWYTDKRHSEIVAIVAWSPNSKQIASGSGDNTVQVWNAADGSQSYIYKGHSKTVNTVA